MGRYLLKIFLYNQNPKSKDTRQRAFRAGSILLYRNHSRRTPEVVTNRGKFPLAPCYWTTEKIPEILHRGGKDEETSPVREGYFLDWFFVGRNERLMGSKCKFCSKAGCRMCFVILFMGALLWFYFMKSIVISFVYYMVKLFYIQKNIFHI